MIWGADENEITELKETTVVSRRRENLGLGWSQCKARKETDKRKVAAQVKERKKRQDEKQLLSRGDSHALMVHGVDSAVVIAALRNVVLALLIARWSRRRLVELTVPRLAAGFASLVHLVKGIPGLTSRRHVIHTLLADRGLGLRVIERPCVLGGILLRGKLLLLLLKWLLHHLLVAGGDRMLNHVV